MPPQELTSDLGTVVAKFLLTPFNQTLAALPHEYIQLCHRHMLLQSQETWVSCTTLPRLSPKNYYKPS